MSPAPAAPPPRPIRVGLVAFPGLTQLDLTGPHEVFSRLPDAEVLVAGPARDPVEAEGGLKIVPDAAWAEAPAFDVLCVPGGTGVNALMEDGALLEFLRRQAGGARYVTSVCTGALLLGAAGLLRSYRATTHWLSLDLLPIFGAIPVAERIVVDRNRITGGGITAGIDFALAVAAEIHGPAVAQRIQLMLEYDPAPPFPGAGSPATAPPDVVDDLRQKRAALQQERRAICQRAAARFSAET